MPRTRDLAVATGFAIVVIFGAAFVAEIRAAIAAAFPAMPARSSAARSS